MHLFVVCIDAKHVSKVFNLNLRWSKSWRRYIYFCWKFFDFSDIPKFPAPPLSLVIHQILFILTKNFFKTSICMFYSSRTTVLISMNCSVFCRHSLAFRFISVNTSSLFASFVLQDQTLCIDRLDLYQLEILPIILDDIDS